MRPPSSAATRGGRFEVGVEGKEATALVDLGQKSAKLSILVARGEVTSAELLEAYESFLDSSPTPFALLNRRREP